jgi:ATP-dependent DNA helicase RecQ
MQLGAARAALKSVFGYDQFRPGQEEIIGWVLAGEDVFAVMPTGSGKSICYQLPAILDGGLTVVISPLIALMRDQVRQLEAVGVAAATLNSASDPAESRDTWTRLESGDLRLLFLSPERLAGNGLLGKLRACGAKRLAIDEAHCVSQWGHDFRPEYRQIARIREALAPIQIVALTATADPTTRADIAAQLFPRPPRILVHSFDRPNIALRFAAKERPKEQIADHIARHRGMSGIVYTASRSRAESIALSLEKRGHRALPYHAGMKQAVRARHQDVFLQDDGVVMVATIAFGMGINKPDVRFVIHADMPGGIESYYQEIGRAGRDGLPADTLTLYGIDDMVLRRRQIEAKDLTEEQRRIEHKRLTAMLDLCESVPCRRQALLAYFGEGTEPCGACDLCAGAAKMADATLEARKLLSAVARTGQRFGAGHLADILRGEETELIRRHGHQTLKTFGVGADRSKRAWAVTTRQLFAAGALAEASEEHGGFCLTEKGEAILFGRETIALRQTAEPVGRRERRARDADRAARLDGLDEAGAARFERLRAVRAELARAEGVAAFMIFPDRTLIEMARLEPKTLEAVRAVHGVGERKLARYGKAFLGAVTDQVER